MIINRNSKKKTALMKKVNNKQQRNLNGELNMTTEIEITNVGVAKAIYHIQRYIHISNKSMRAKHLIIQIILKEENKKFYSFFLNIHILKYNNNMEL